MIEDTLQQTPGQKPGVRPASPMAMCPMAGMCEGMMKNPHSDVYLMLPGVLLIALGVLIFIEPRIVVWLIGALAILAGIMFFMMARFIGRFHRPSF